MSGVNIMEAEKDILRTVSKEETNLRNMRKSIRAIEKFTEDEPVDNLHKIKQEITKVEKILKQTKLEGVVKESVEQRIQPVTSKIPEWEEQARKIFGQKFKYALKQVDSELDGNYPLFKVLFYTLDVNLDNSNAIIWYGPQQERLDTCKRIPEVIVQKLVDNHAKITQRDFDDKTFLSNLYEAYRLTSCQNGKEIGDSLPILDVLLAYTFLIQNKKFKTDPVKRSYTEYGRVFFSYDLYRLKERNIENRELGLVTAIRAYTRRRSDFLWMPYSERGDGTYISHITFGDA